MLALGVAAALLAACAATQPHGDDDASTTSSSVGAGEEEPDEREAPPEPHEGVEDDPADEPAPQPPATALPPAPDAPAPFELSANEPLPNAKRLASDVVQALTTYEPDDTPGELLERVVSLGPGADVDVDALAATIAPLYHDEAWSRGEIVYPQLGGATATDVAVMVVVRQTAGHPDGTVTDETRTIDVRLTLVDGAWAFASVEDAGGVAIPRPATLAPEATAVLDDDRIELPDSAVWDIHAGTIGRELLALMSELAERHRYGVVVLDTGHPTHVFDTDTISSHLYGLAVDVYHLDGQLVVDAHDEGSAAHELVTWLFDHEDVVNLGSPWALDGFGGRSFTDIVHLDHLHIQAGRRPPGPPPHRPDLAKEPADEDAPAG